MNPDHIVPLLPKTNIKFGSFGGNSCTIVQYVLINLIIYFFVIAVVSPFTSL